LNPSHSALTLVSVLTATTNPYSLVSWTNNSWHFW